MQPNITCSVCTMIEAAYFCPCKIPLSFLCEQHIPIHFAKHRGFIHEVLPIEVLSNFQVPGFVEDYRRRTRTKEEAVRQLSAVVDQVDEWTAKACRKADLIVSRATAFRANIEREMKQLKLVLKHDIEMAIKENEAKFFEAHPETGPLVQALRCFEPEANLSVLTCKTDFEDWEKALDAFLFKLTVHLETTLPTYKLLGTITDVAQLQSSCKLRIYNSAQAYAPALEAVHSKYGPYECPADATPLVKRGPVLTPTGVYIGEWNNDNKRHGRGVFIGNNGDVYEGSWVEGEKHGQGRQAWADGHVYEGEWKNQLRHGFGKLTGTGGDVYTGEYCMNKQQGFGYYQWAPSASSQFYVGEWANGQTNGIGAYFWRDGSIYAGYRKNHKKHGKAVMYWPDGRMYYGDFATDLMNGKGCMCWPNGEMYAGEWREGKRWGKGKQTASESYYAGKWSEDKKHGAGTESINGSKECEVRYREDVRV